MWLSMRHQAESLVITIEDQGTEFPEHVSIERPESTGLQIATALVSQIGGSIELERKPHTKWIIKVPFSVAEGTEGLECIPE